MRVRFHFICIFYFFLILLCTCWRDLVWINVSSSQIRRVFVRYDYKLQSAFVEGFLSRIFSSERAEFSLLVFLLLFFSHALSNPWMFHQSLGLFCACNGWCQIFWCRYKGRTPPLRRKGSACESFVCDLMPLLKTSSQPQYISKASWVYWCERCYIGWNCAQWLVCWNKGVSFIIATLNWLSVNWGDGTHIQ